MIVCSISDTHGCLADIPKCDILTVSGDISPAVRGYEGVVKQREYFFEHFLPWYTKNCVQLVFIAGNHDLFLRDIFNRDLEDKFRNSLPHNVHYLRDSEVDINGLRIYGSPWTPMFCNWYFMDKDNADGIGKHFAKIPNGIDILLTHGPAAGHNDICLGDVKRLGSQALVDAVRRACPRYLFCGHIHSGDHNESLISPSVNGKEYIRSRNVSILDEGYRAHYQAIAREIG